MRKIHAHRFPRSFNEGGPARKLMSAAQAVIEPMEGRLMQSVTPTAVVSQHLDAITSTTTSTSASSSRPVVYVNATDASKDLIVNISASGQLNVSNVSGKTLSSQDKNVYGSVALVDSFSLNGKNVTLVVATNLSQKKLSLFTLDTTSGKLNYVNFKSIFPSVSGTISAVTTYQNESGQTYAFIATKSGAIEQFELTDHGNGRLLGKSVRTIQVGSDVEGLAVDDSTGALYVSEASVGIWKYGADATDGSVRVAVDTVGGNGHLTDAAGLSLFKTDATSGYLVASDGNGGYAVYDRASGNYIEEITVGTDTTAGSADSSTSMLSQAFVIQDNTSTDSGTFKIVSLADLVSGQATPVTTPVSTPVSTPVTTPVSTPVTTPVSTPVTTPVSTSVTTPVTTPTPVTASTGRPSEATTGVQDGITLKTVSSSSLSISSGDTISNLYINGQVTLTGKTNVTLINCVINAGNASYGVRCDNASGIVIKNCEIVNVASAGIYGQGFSAIGNFIHQSAGDGIKPISDALIQGNYITDLGWFSPAAHADGVQIRGGSNITIIGNFFNLPENVANTKSNSALFLQLDASNVTFSNNWVLGGNFSVHAYSDLTGDAHISITNNIFYTGSTLYGFGTVGSTVVWTGNVNDLGTSVLAKDK